MLSKLAKFVLSLLFRFFSRSRYQVFHVAKGSRVAFWRIKPSQSNSLSVGTQTIIESKIVFERHGAVVSVGDRTFIGNGTITVASNISIGNDVMIAWGASIADHNSHSISYSKRRYDVVNWMQGKKIWDDIILSPVVICDRAWIGFNSIILKGITIGEGAVVGAGSVVTKDVPPWTIVAGNPARIIREIPENER